MKKIIQNLTTLFLAILAVTIVYGGINLADLNLKNVKASQNQEDFANKISNLENKLNESENKNSDFENRLNDLQKKLDDYKKIASAPKQILGAETQEPKEVIKYIEKEPVIKTVTQTITQTITQGVEKNQAVVTIENLGSYRVDLKDSDNAFTILKRAGVENGFPIEYQEYSFGVFITAIGAIMPRGNQYWAFYYNGKFSMVGASSQSISKNDTTFWRLESF